MACKYGVFNKNFAVVNQARLVFPNIHLSGKRRRQISLLIDADEKIEIQSLVKLNSWMVLQRICGVPAWLSCDQNFGCAQQ